MSRDYLRGSGMGDSDQALAAVLKQLYSKSNKKGKVVLAPFGDSTFKHFGIDKDLAISNNDHSIAWTHRQTAEEDIYFLSNQKNAETKAHISFRGTNKNAEVWDPVTAKITRFNYSESKNGKANAAVHLQPNQSVFIVFRKKSPAAGVTNKISTHSETILFNDKWSLKFDKEYGTDTTIKVDELRSWTENADPAIKFYSGTVTYSNSFGLTDKSKITDAIIELQSVDNIASIKVNGIDCGTLWTPPYKLDISKAIKNGENKIEIEVANTWHNRLIGDNLLLPEKRITFTTAPFRLKDKPLLPAGLVGDVKIIIR